MLVTGALDVGGLDEVVAFLARRLPLEQFAVSVLHVLPPNEDAARGHLGSDGHLARQLRDEGVPVAHLAERDVGRHLAMTEPDVISAHGVPNAVLEAASVLTIPVVETLHGMHSLYDLSSRVMEAERSRLVTAFVAVSDLVRTEYLACNPTYPPGQVITIPNSVDDTRIPLVDRVAARQWLGITDDFLFVSLAR